MNSVSARLTWRLRRSRRSRCLSRNQLQRDQVDPCDRADAERSKLADENGPVPRAVEHRVPNRVRRRIKPARTDATLLCDSRREVTAKVEDLRRRDIHHIEVDGRSVGWKEPREHSGSSANQDHLGGLVRRKQCRQRLQSTAQLVGVERRAAHVVLLQHTSSGLGFSRSPPKLGDESSGIALLSAQTLRVLPEVGRSNTALSCAGSSKRFTRVP